MSQTTFSKKQAYQFILLFGLVSLLGDVVYEGARSITGPFLATLGASAAAVGLIAGLGEFLGYALRLVSGLLSDRFRSYWGFTFAGYGLLLAVPLLALTGSWQVAAVLLILERLGKGIRTPARDSLLSQATAEVGHGRGFGLHEALDQIGAIIGPLIVGLILGLKHSYHLSFAVLFLPALGAIVCLKIAKKNPIEVPSKVAQHKLSIVTKRPKLLLSFWSYLLFSFFSVMGFVSFQMLAYHFRVHYLVSDSQIAVFYAIAMGIDAVTALIIGRVYDVIGFKCLAIIPVLSSIIPALVFSLNKSYLLIGIAVWGIVIGIHETIMRAAIADLIPLEQRATAYGLFNTAYGLALFLGNGLIGWLYDINVALIVSFVLIVELISLPFWGYLIRQGGSYG